MYVRTCAIWCSVRTILSLSTNARVRTFTKFDLSH